jgi:pectate lyase
MAGRVLRDSNGRYAGSTRGWGSGRSTHGGGFGGGKKGRTRSVKNQRRIDRLVKVGKSVGINAASTVVLGGASHIAMKRYNIDPQKVAVASLVTGVGYQASRKVLRQARRRR